jgi:hypothetical protein
MGQPISNIRICFRTLVLQLRVVESSINFRAKFEVVVAPAIAEVSNLHLAAARQTDRRGLSAAKDF